MKNKKKTILIVEDEFFLAETLKDRFEFLGYDVLYAENGEEAIRLLQSSKVDLVVMDVIMPVMDGFEATRKIRADEKLKKIPVIILTAKARLQDEKESMAVGANDYMTKPFNADELVKKIEKWISK